MSDVKLSKRQGGSGYTLVVDGVDISASVTEVQITVTGHGAVVAWSTPISNLDVDLPDAEVAPVEVPK